MAQGGRRLNQPGTFLRAGIVLAILGVLAAAVAALWPQPSIRSPVDAYLRQGPAAGAEALRRDLLAQSPIGSDAGPSVQRLVSMGFTCDAPDGSSGTWTCLFRRPDPERRLVSVEAKLRVGDGAVTAVEARITPAVR